MQAASIDTGDTKRDEHLRGASFFDVERHPEMRFVSRLVERNGEGRFRVFGDLTIKGQTHELALEAVVTSHSNDHDLLRIGAQGELMRSRFGLSWREALEASGVLVSDRVKIALEVVARRGGAYAESTARPEG